MNEGYEAKREQTSRQQPNTNVHGDFDHVIETIARSVWFR
jgi:hypothetical protein